MFTSAQTTTTPASNTFVPPLPIPFSTPITPVPTSKKRQSVDPAQSAARPLATSVGEENNNERDFELSFCGRFVGICKVFALVDAKELSRAELKKKQLDE